MTYRRRKRENVRMAVVGVGGMGANHARVLAGLKGVDLIAVVDADHARASAIAELNDCSVVGNYHELKDRVDAVCVAVPSSLHATVGAEMMQMGIHCLIEKPLATSESEVARLMAAQSRAGVELLVGHIERFNPAVVQLQKILDGEETLVLNARRMSAVSSRITDVDVISDLMVHDIDIVLSLFGSPPLSVQATGLMGANGADHCVAVLTFSGGRMASLTASRITQNQIRSLEATTRDRYYTIDYPNQALQIFRQGRIGTMDGAGNETGNYVLDVGTERVFVRRQEPLAQELSHFVDVVRGTESPWVSATAALETLRVVWRVQEQLANQSRHLAGAST